TFARGVHVVENVVRTAAVDPPLRIVAKPVQKVEHWIRFRSPNVISRRRVDIEVTVVVRDGRMKSLPRDGALRDIGPRHTRLRAWDDEHALEPGESRLPLAVVRVGDRLPVDDE